MRVLPTALGVVVGKFAAPTVLNAIGVSPAEGFGMDDFAEAAIITAAIVLAHKVL